MDGVSVLSALLADQEVVLDRMVVLVDCEQTAVVANDVVTLGTLIAEKERLTAELDRLELRRAEWLAEFAAATGLPKDVSLADVAGGASVPVRDDLLARKERLATKLLAVAEKNKRNRLLITSVVRVVHRTIERVHQLRNERASYAPGGVRRPAAMTAVVDRKA